jgi:dihydroorotase
MNTDPAKVCGIKLFMGASTVTCFENENALKELFRRADMPVAAHCEDEQTIRRNANFTEEIW